MTVRVTELAGGLRVVTDAMTSVETVALGAWVGVGARHESVARGGISHLLEHMVFKGTARRTARQIAEEMDDVGGQLNAYTSHDHTAFVAELLADDLALGVDIIADLLTAPKFDADELAREAEVVVQEIHQAADQPDDVAGELFQKAAYGDQPLARPVLGTVDSVRATSSADLRDHLTGWYTRANTVVAAAGKVDHDAFVRQVEAAFAALPEGSVSAPASAVYWGGDERKNVRNEQVHLLLGFPGVTYTDPDFYSAAAFSTLFGEGMSSRLFQEVRENRGLVYAVYSSLMPSLDTGVFSVYAGTSPDNLVETVGVLRAEILKARDDVTDAEVRRAKAQMTTGLLMSLESTAARCRHAARQVQVFGEPLTTTDLRARVDRVTTQGVQAAANAMLGGALAVAAVGPVRKLQAYGPLAMSLECAELPGGL